ncbi:MAG: mechanosensitive ion channel family protein [Synechococcaceae cyanobacterium]|nr:mechanosensitive ion channel family protein [Synechococcaceae cyanobacterium]
MHPCADGRSGGAAAQHRQRQPEAALERELRSLDQLIGVGSQTDHPDKPKVPGPSPALTVDRFLERTLWAEDTIRKAVARGLAEPGWFFSDAVNQQANDAINALQQAAQSLDLSAVPKALRSMSGVGTVLMLQSLLRYELSRDASLIIPDAEQVRRDGLTSWTIPDSTITLTAISPAQARSGKVCSGCGAGDFLFSAETVAQVPDLFADLFGMDYKRKLRYGANLYTYWALLPGDGLPPKLFLSLPVAIRRALLFEISGQSLLQWLLLIPMTLGVLVAMVWWVSRLHRWQRRRGALVGALPQILGLGMLLPLLLLVWFWQWYAIEWINLIGPREAAALVIVRLAEGLLQALLAYLVAETIGQLMTLRRERDGINASRLERRKGSGQILTVARLAGVLASLAVLIQTAQDLGLTSLTLIGLASVPALAISLGTQQLIRDIADGFSLLFDGQLQAGDPCTVATSKSGVIKGKIASLGMRSTRIRQEDGAMLSLPNSQVAGSVVTNFRFRDADLLQLSLPIATELLPRTPMLLEQARQWLADCPELHGGGVELEATDSGWNLQLHGRWQSSLANEALSAAKQRLYLQLIQLTHLDSQASRGT